MKRRAPMLLLLVALVLPAVVAAAGEAAAPGGSHGWLSVLPPVLAIGLALVTRQVVVALLLGVYVGAVVIEGNPFTAFLRLGDRYLIDALADRSHASILIFTSILGGMVGVLSRSGATEGVVHWLAGHVRGRRGGHDRDRGHGHGDLLRRLRQHPAGGRDHAAADGPPEASRARSSPGWSTARRRRWPPWRSSPPGWASRWA